MPLTTTFNVVFTSPASASRASRSGAMWDDVKWGHLARHGVGTHRAGHRRRLDAPPHQGVLVVGADGQLEGLPDRASPRGGEGLGSWLSDVEMINAVTLVTADMDESVRVLRGDWGSSRCRWADAARAVHDLPGRRRVPQRAARSRPRAGALHLGTGDLLGRRRRCDARARIRTRVRALEMRRRTRRGVSATSTCTTSRRPRA